MKNLFLVPALLLVAAVVGCGKNCASPVSDTAVPVSFSLVNNGNGPSTVEYVASSPTTYGTPVVIIVPVNPPGQPVSWWHSPEFYAKPKDLVSVCSNNAEEIALTVNGQDFIASGSADICTDATVGQ